MPTPSKPRRPRQSSRPVTPGDCRLAHSAGTEPFCGDLWEMLSPRHFLASIAVKLASLDLHATCALSEVIITFADRTTKPMKEAAQEGRQRASGFGGQFVLRDGRCLPRRAPAS